MGHIQSFQSFINYMNDIQSKKIKEQKDANRIKCAELFKNKLE